MRRESRLESIAAAKAEIEQRAAERFVKEQEAHQANVATHKAKEKTTGKKLRGCTPTPPNPGSKSKDQVNITERDSRIMLSFSGGFGQSYNAQASVDVDSMLVAGTYRYRKHEALQPTSERNSTDKDDLCFLHTTRIEA